jgi:hypothetical protein
MDAACFYRDDCGGSRDPYNLRSRAAKKEPLGETRELRGTGGAAVPALTQPPALTAAPTDVMETVTMANGRQPTW